MMYKVFCLILLQCLVAYASLESDAGDNQVLIQLDLVQSKDWGTDVINAFKSSIARFSGDFCHTNLSACSMERFSEFTANDVVIVQGYPQLKDVNTLMKLFVVLPESTSNDENVFVLRKAVLAGIITTNRIGLQDALIFANKEKYEASYRVSYVDDVLVLEPSDQTLNKIIIPIACGVVTLMALVVLGLQLKK